MTTTGCKATTVAAAGTAIGTSRRGTLANMPAVELAKPVGHGSRATVVAVEQVPHHRRGRLFY